jgi:hypothetical protein
MPQQMSSQDVVRELRRIRYSPRKGRRLGLTWVAFQTGYARHSLYRAIIRGWVSRPMAERLANVFIKTVTFSRGYTTFPSNLEPLDADAALTDGRGRWPRRPSRGRKRHGQILD